MTEPLDLDTRLMVLGAAFELEDRPIEKSIVNDAEAEIARLRSDNVRLRGQLENVKRDRMAHAENARLRALITEWAETMGDKTDSFGGLARYEAARDALREEANR